MMVDSHAHLDFSQFEGDRGETVRRALETGVAAIIDMGYDLASSYAAVALAEHYLALGCSISLAGPVTYPNAARQAILAQELPLMALLVETEASFLPPQSHRGRRNEPAYLEETMARIATLKEIEPAAAEAATAARLFGISV